MKPTRYYSDKQEKYIAKSLDGKKQSNSGATTFQKGDILTDLFCIEAKTRTTESKTFVLQKDWIDKNREEAIAMGKPYSAVVIDFGDGKQHYIINESLFRYLNDRLQEDI